MSLTSPYSILLACPKVRLKNGATRSSHAIFLSKGSGGTAARMIDWASATECIGVSVEREKISGFRDMSAPRLALMTNAPFKRSRKLERLGTVLSRVLPGIVAAQRNAGLGAPDRAVDQAGVKGTRLTQGEETSQPRRSAVVGDEGSVGGRTNRIIQFRTVGSPAAGLPIAPSLQSGPADFFFGGA